MSWASALLIAVSGVFLFVALIAAGAVIAYFSMWVVEMAEVLGQSWFHQPRPGVRGTSR